MGGRPSYLVHGRSSRVNFQKSAKRGVIFNPKIYVGNFGNFKQGFLSMKLIQYSNFRVQDMFFNNCIGKNKNETHFEESCCSRNSLMEGSRYQIG